jgi:hypothetical protein
MKRFAQSELVLKTTAMKLNELQVWEGHTLVGDIHPFFYSFIRSFVNLKYLNSENIMNGII